MCKLKYEGERGKDFEMLDVNDVWKKRQQNYSFFFCNPILFAICTSTFSKLCKKNVYSGM
jgi:hypothetical protein